MEKSCCECKHGMLWYDEEILCLLKNECVNGNDAACSKFQEDD